MDIQECISWKLIDLFHEKKLILDNKEEKNYFVLKLHPPKHTEPFALENEIIRIQHEGWGIYIHFSGSSMLMKIEHIIVLY